MFNFDAADLEAIDKRARRALTTAKRAKRIVVRGSKVYLRVSLRGFIHHEIIDLLCTVVNIAAHGKSYAPKEASKELQNLHRAVRTSYEFRVPLVFDLSTGDLKLDPAPRETWDIE